jgi:hypothetical protein
MVVITVTPVNDQPVAINDTATTKEDVPVIINVQSNEVDIDGDSLITTIIGVSTQGVTPTVLDNDSISYTPPTNFAGKDSLLYEICDTGNPKLCDTALVVITVEMVNDTPSIMQPPVTVFEDSIIKICPLITDVDAGDSLTVTTCNSPSNGVVIIDNHCVTYTPNAGYVGKDTVCMIVCDKGGLCDSIMIPIRVRPSIDLAVVKLIDPCNCLGNESALNAGDGQFSERIQVTSFSGETWYIATVKGLYQNPTAPIFPPPSNNGQYPLSPFATGPQGVILKETPIGNDKSTYTLEGIHIDAIGYAITLSNGEGNLSSRQTCHYDASCQFTVIADSTGTPSAPMVDPCTQKFIISAHDTHLVDSLKCCDADKNTFIDDGLVDGLYQDDSIRNTAFTICPQNQWQTIMVNFKDFDLAQGDTLSVFEGLDTLGIPFTKMSGTGTSSANGGWVSANCDPAINEKGCLTFLFKTNGDRNKGRGWNATINCNDRAIKLNPPNNLVANLDCDSISKVFTILPATIKTDCGLLKDSQIVRIYNAHNELCIDTCLAANVTFTERFGIGSYLVEYKLKSDTVKTTQAILNVQEAALICNDNLNIPLGSNCAVLITPDDLLENTCDTINNALYYYISLKGVDKKGKEILLATGGGKGGNYPMLTKAMIGNCGGTVKATIERRYYEGLKLPFCNNGQQSASCATEIRLVDQSAPIFESVTAIDTFKLCSPTLSPENLGLKAPLAIDNCDTVQVNFKEATLIKDGSICGVTEAQITWEATDGCGNTSSISQMVVILRPDANDIVEAKDIVLSCGEDAETALQNLAKTGQPGLKVGKVKNGILIPTDTIALDTAAYTCGYILQKREVQIPADCGIKVYRYWELLDWCNSSAGITLIDTQLIELKDTLAPQFTVESLPVTAIELAHDACSYDIATLTQPAATDNCTAANVQIDSAFRIADGEKIALNKAELKTLDCDSFLIRWVAIDACHEQTKADTLYQTIIIQDLTKPSAVCTDQLNLSIVGDKLAIHYKEIEAGSYDACGIAKYEVSRDEIHWDSVVLFNCEDVHQQVAVYLRVTDIKGNQNTCWTFVNVEDKIAPICNDLSDRKENCDEYHSGMLGASTDANNNGLMDDDWKMMSLAQMDLFNTRYGNPNCADNLACNDLTIEQQYQLIEKNCGIVQIQRRYRAIDWNGEGNVSNWATQNILVEYKADWTITLPADWSGTCGEAIPSSELSIQNGNCDLMAYEVEEKVYTTVEDACLKVVRTFTIINWCNYDANGAVSRINRVEDEHGQVHKNRIITAKDFEKAGKLEYVQILKLKDDTAPIITAKEVNTCIDEGCSQSKQFAITATDCNEKATESLKYAWELSANGVKITNGVGATFEAIVSANTTYKVRWTVADNCGNTAWEDFTYDFQDCKKPSPYCLHGIAVDLMDNVGRVQIWAKDVERGSADNCTSVDKLEYRIWHASLGAAPTELEAVQALPKAITLSCNNLGNQTLNLYVIDEQGNWDYCTTYVNVQDNSNTCTTTQMAMVSGVISDWKARRVEEVMVKGGTASYLTQTEGHYALELAMENDYTIAPAKETNPLNGVSTFDLVLISKHILGIAPFENPYQFIAADINQSGTITAFDMVQLRQLILNITNDFPNNSSWRFVEADYQFTTNQPLLENFPEVGSIKDLQKDMEMSFVAIKVGDVNGNAQPNALMMTEERTSADIFEIIAQDRDLKAGVSYQIDFTTKALHTIQGYQFTLAYEDLKVEQLIGGLSNKGNFGLHAIDNGWLTTSWNQSLTKNQPQGAENTALFTIEFTALRDGKLSEQLHLVNRPTTVEAYNQEGANMDVALRFTKPDNNEFELFQNNPNPFDDRTSIGFYLPSDSEIVLTLRDETGRILNTYKDFRKAGYNSIELSKEASMTGLIYYQLSTKFGVKTKKMLRLR